MFTARPDFAAAANQVRLPAKERGDLQHVCDFSDWPNLGNLVNVR